MGCSLDIFLGQMLQIIGLPISQTFGPMMWIKQDIQSVQSKLSGPLSTRPLNILLWALRKTPLTTKNNQA